MTSLFVYGTLMKSAQLDSVLWRHHTSAKIPATLLNFDRVVVKDQWFPAIYPEKGRSVEGLLIEGLDAEDWEKLDQYEGELYSKEDVKVKVAAGILKAKDNMVKAKAYVIKPEYEYLLTNEEWEVG